MLPFLDRLRAVARRHRLRHAARRPGRCDRRRAAGAEGHRQARASRACSSSRPRAARRAAGRDVDRADRPAGRGGGGGAAGRALLTAAALLPPRRAAPRRVGARARAGTLAIARDDATGTRARDKRLGEVSPTATTLIQKLEADPDDRRGHVRGPVSRAEESYARFEVGRWRRRSDDSRPEHAAFKTNVAPINLFDVFDSPGLAGPRHSPQRTR